MSVGPTPRTPVRRATAGLALLGAMAIGGGTWIQSRARHDGQATADYPRADASESWVLVRVLATPWAEVWVDGERIDTTPFARKIALDPETHDVTFSHPNAPVEKRTVAIAAGEVLERLMSSWPCAML